MALFKAVSFLIYTIDAKIVAFFNKQTLCFAKQTQVGYV